MAAPILYGGAPAGGSLASRYNPNSNSNPFFTASGVTPSTTSAVPAQDEPRSNLPFDPRMKRTAASHNVVGGVITTDTPALKYATSSMGSITIPPFYCFFLFNPADITTQYGFDNSVSGQLPATYLNPSTWGYQAGGILTQTVSFNLLFDRTYEVWNGVSNGLPPSAFTFFGQNTPTFPQNGGPYRFGVLWDVWALERICGIYGQAKGLQPSGPPTATIVHVMAGDVRESNAINGPTWGDVSQNTVIQEPLTPSSIDFYGWITSMSVDYTRFDANMTPTRCAVSLSFQQTYAQPYYNSNTGSANTSSAVAPNPFLSASS